MNAVNKDALTAATLCITMNTVAGLAMRLAVGPSHTFEGLRAGLGVGIAIAPIMILSLAERKPLVTAPIIMALAWTMGGLVMLGSGSSQTIGKLVFFATVALACLIAVTVLRRDSESQPVCSCPECGYDLFGIHEGACPECGRPWKASDIPRRPTDRLPWSLGDYERWTLGFAASMSLSVTCLAVSLL